MSWPLSVELPKHLGGVRVVFRDHDACLAWLLREYWAGEAGSEEHLRGFLRLGYVLLELKQTDDIAFVIMSLDLSAAEVPAGMTAAKQRERERAEARFEQYIDGKAA